jgi:copper chaperone CopZ
MTESIKIHGMSCDGCVASVRRAIERLPIEKTSVSIGTAEVVYDDTTVTHQQIVEAIEDAGYEVETTSA